MPKDVLDQLGSLTLEKDHFLVNINKARRRGGGQDRGDPRAGGPGGGRESRTRRKCPSFVRKSHGRDGSRR